MALIGVAPWQSFSPLDFTNYAAQGDKIGTESFTSPASAGGGLGVHLAQIGTSANEAANALQFRYAELAAQNARAAQAQAFAQQQHAAALAIEKQKADTLENYRLGRLGQFGDEEERKREAMAQLAGYRTDRLSQIDQSMADKRSAADALQARFERMFGQHAQQFGIKETRYNQALRAREMSSLRKSIQEKWADPQMMIKRQTDPSTQQEFTEDMARISLIDQEFQSMINANPAAGTNAGAALMPNTTEGLEGVGAEAAGTAAEGAAETKKLTYNPETGELE